MIENVLLREVIEFIIQNALPVTLVYWILGRPFIEAWLEMIKDWVQTNLGISVSAIKRYAAVVLSVGISLGVFALYAKLGYATLPTTFEGWANLILSLGAINFTGTQLVHSKDIRKRP